LFNDEKAQAAKKRTEEEGGKRGRGKAFGYVLQGGRWNPACVTSERATEGKFRFFGEEKRSFVHAEKG